MTAYRDRLEAGHYAPAAESDHEDEMTVDELKDELKKRDLPVSGSKAELQARLDEADE